jgi:hypothetical protein
LVKQHASQIAPLAVAPTNHTTPLQRYARLKKMILFEIVHEDAAVWDWQVLWSTILLPGTIVGFSLPIYLPEDVNWISQFKA